MSEASGQDRTERASPKRLREARERGQVPRSRELSGAVLMTAAVGTMMVAGHHVAEGAVRWLRSALSFRAADLADPTQLPLRLGALMHEAMMLVAPVLGACFMAALAAPMLIGGWNLSTKALVPDFSRLNPLKGFGRIFSSQSLAELLRNLGKLVLLGMIALVCFWGVKSTLLAMPAQSPATAIGDGLAVCLRIMVWLCGGLLLIAAIDLPWQLWKYARDLRMTRQELRDEYKQSEGRPEVKGRIRRLQQEMANRRMMEKVPGADVVVTNPTHYAVALKYAAGGMRAPRVVAKGAGPIAQRIRELAVENRVTLVSAPPLARALYRGVDLDAEIPAALYAAVAQVLTYVYQLRAHRRGPVPRAPDVGDVPGGEPDPDPNQDRDQDSR